MSEIDIDKGEPIVLLVDVATEGLRSALKTSRLHYKLKRLDSRPENWNEITSYFTAFQVKAAVVKLMGHTYNLLVNPKYAQVREGLFQQLRFVPHAIFVYEDLLKSSEDLEPAENLEPADEAAVVLPDSEHLFVDPFVRPTAEVRASVLHMMSDLRLNVIPYRSNAELSVLATELVNDACNGLLFRVYVPAGRIWANELDKLLQLFRDYLTRIGHPDVRLDQRRTQNGIEYEFFGLADTATSRDGKPLSEHFHDFTKVLDLSASDPAAAETILRASSVDPREIAGILTRYAKEATRLHLDMKHEREQKLLSIRQRLESDLAERLPNGDLWSLIDRLVECTLPPVPGISRLIAAERGDTHALTTGDITINFGPHIQSVVDSVVASEISGKVALTSADRQILDLVEKYAPERTADVEADVQVLADASVSRQTRMSAVQRVKGLLYQVAAKVPDVGVGLLVSYLEKRYMG